MILIYKFFKKSASIFGAALFMFMVMQLSSFTIAAQDEKTAVIKLSFTQNDSTNHCVAKVTGDSGAVKGTEVHFYVKRLFSLLPIGKAVETDENGLAEMDYPLDLPGDDNRNFIVVAKIEEDDNYGTVETQAEVKWGAQIKAETEPWNKRSLSASREKAPYYLIIASNLIIAVIWGTIFYVILQIFRIRKASKILIKNKSS